MELYFGRFKIELKISDTVLLCQAYAFYMRLSRQKIDVLTVFYIEFGVRVKY